MNNMLFTDPAITRSRKAGIISYIDMTTRMCILSSPFFMQVGVSCHSSFASCFTLSVSVHLTHVAVERVKQVAVARVKRG